ncbi:MAG: RNA methyltransferase, partial [Planctomycetota bacterium]
NIHRGFMALGRYCPPGDLDDILARAPACVICEDLANHDNVGGIFRSVRALAPEGTVVLLSPRCCDPLYRKALRVSMGNALHVPFATLDPWPAEIERVANAGFELVAMHPAADSRPISDAASKRPAILVGAEGPGLTSRALAAVADHSGISVRIPIDPAADSLNVGVAAAIALNSLCPRDGNRAPHNTSDPDHTGLRADSTT